MTIIARNGRNPPADGSLADANRLRQANACGLVAHVRAVGEVVGAEFAGEKLNRNAASFDARPEV